MKQFIRYLLLIACVMLVGVWGWSLFHCDTFFHKGLKTEGVFVSDGELCLLVGDRYPFDPEGWEFVQNPPLPGYRRNGVGNELFRFLGLMVIHIPVKPDHWLSKPLGYKIIVIPIWMLVAPLSLITLKLWYHPIKNWWRGTNRQGFAVEVRTDENRMTNDE